MTFKLPPFGKFVDALNVAGVETRTARGFWGGIVPNGDVVLVGRFERRQRPLHHLASEHKPRGRENVS